MEMGIGVDVRSKNQRQNGDLMAIGSVELASLLQPTSKIRAYAESDSNLIGILILEELC